MGRESVGINGRACHGIWLVSGGHARRWKYLAWLRMPVAGSEEDPSCIAFSGVSVCYVIEI
jgi:hypothetical protein